MIFTDPAVNARAELLGHFVLIEERDRPAFLYGLNDFERLRGLLVNHTIVRYLLLTLIDKPAECSQRRSSISLRQVRRFRDVASSLPRERPVVSRGVPSSCSSFRSLRHYHAPVRLQALSRLECVRFCLVLVMMNLRPH